MSGNKQKRIIDIVEAINFNKLCKFWDHLVDEGIVSRGNYSKKEQEFILYDFIGKSIKYKNPKI